MQPASVQTPCAAKRLLLVDDHALLRFGMCSLLQSHDAAVSVTEAACLTDALATYRDHGPFDLVLMDLNMNDCRGLQGLRQFMQTSPEAQVVILSATTDDFVIDQALALGARAFLTKSMPPQSLVQEVLRWLREPTQALSAAEARKRQGKSRWHRVAELGPRHVEILDQVLYGCSNQEISNATGLSLGTVKNYVSTILLALDVKSRSHLISVFR